jgi:hypothetical protein
METTETTETARRAPKTRGEVGVDPAGITRLGRVHGDSRELAAGWTARFLLACPDWVEDHVGATRFRWADHWRDIPADLLSCVFTRDERARMWHDEVIDSKLNQHIEEQEPLLWKTQHALWRYGESRDYSRFVTCYNHIADLSIDLPGFAIRLTHTRYCNTAAWAAHGRESPIYLDASFGALLHYRGVHVMTIGFAPSADGILVAQAQLRERTGNRFLYRLPAPHLDVALDLVARAFPGDDLYLVTGESTVAAIRRAYHPDPDRLDPTAAARIRGFYDQPLRDYLRTGDVVHGSSDDGRKFTRLTRKPTRGS